MSSSKLLFLTVLLVALALFQQNAAANTKKTSTQSVTLKSKTKLKLTDYSKFSLKKKAALGKSFYKQYQCFDCHSISGKGCKDGMKLDHLGAKRSKEFISEQLKDPDKHFEKHAEAFDIDLNLMPPQNLEPYEIDSLVEYLHSLK